MEDKLKSLWQKQASPNINAAEIIHKAKKLKQKKFRNTVLVNLTFLATCIFIICIWIFLKPQLVSTKIGMVLFFLAMGLFMVNSLKGMKLFLKSPDNVNNRQYLHQLLKIQQQEGHLQTKIMTWYFIFLGLGFLLYLFEYTQMMPILYGVIAYIFVIGWIALNWFYIRPKIQQKQQKEMDVTIEELRRIVAE